MLRIVLGTLLVLAGLSSALVTVLARRTNENTLAGAAAILSLLIALLLTIFIVPPLARSARVEVANLDFPLEPTSGGGVFLVIIVVVGFAAWNTGNNLLFLVFSLLCSALFVGWMAARTSLRDLTVSARFPDHIFAAEAAPVIVTLRNNKRVLPSFSILVEARGPGNESDEN
jgi:UDP-N-acetylmuramyl pentapeptide phosphotransferase/UDP-N-acetylglucosamine-1-phosphate transferase